MKLMQKIVSVLLVMWMLFAVCTAAVSAAKAPDMSRPYGAHLTFGADGKLKILQVADLQDDEVLGDAPKQLLRAAVERTQPDLIMMTGDNIAGYDCLSKEEAETAIHEFMDLFAEYGIPVAIVFGNHDDDQTALTKDEQIAIYETYDCFIGCRGVTATKTVGDSTVKNVGTYNIPVYKSKNSSKIVYNIWCFDSGNYNPDPEYGGYGYVMAEQVDWYVKTSRALQKANGGKVVPSIAFQHIAPPHIYHALKSVPPLTPGAKEYENKWYSLPCSADRRTNWMHEKPCPPELNFADGYKQLDAMIDRGDVQAVFYGHDHKNHYVVPYEGIDLVSSAGCTYQSYNDWHRGFRLIEIDKNDLSRYTSSFYPAAELLGIDWFYLTSKATSEKVWNWIMQK